MKYTLNPKQALGYLIIGALSFFILTIGAFSLPEQVEAQGQCGATFSCEELNGGPPPSKQQCEGNNSVLRNYTWRCNGGNCQSQTTGVGASQDCGTPGCNGSTGFCNESSGGGDGGGGSGPTDPPELPDQVTINVSKLGPGTVVSTSSPSGSASINCGSSCSSTRDSSSGTWTLQANPSEGYRFVRWQVPGGTAISTENPHAFAVNANREWCGIVDYDELGRGIEDCYEYGSRDVQAVFEVNDYTLTVGKTSSNNGTGTVRSTPAGIDYGATNSHDFTPGTSVTLTPTNGTGIFRGWSGDGTNNGNNRNISMTEDRSVIATFNRPVMTINTNPPAAVSSVTASTGTRTTTSSPWKFVIDRNGTMSPQLTMVVPSSTTSGYRFNSWTGDCTASSLNGCSFTMNDDKTATANFIQRHPLNLTKAGNATGTVTSTTHRNESFSCGTTCLSQTRYFDHNTSVTLTPVTVSRANNTGTGIFRGWTGAGTNSGSNRVVPMTAVRNVTATFDQLVLSTPQIRGTVRTTPFNYTNLPAIKSSSTSKLRAGSYNLGAVVNPSFNSSNPNTNSNSDLNRGYRFTRWNPTTPSSYSSCASTNSTNCTVTMDENRTIQARFSTVAPVVTSFTSGGSDGNGTQSRPLKYDTVARLNWASTDAQDCHLTSIVTPEAGSVDSAFIPHKNVNFSGSNHATSQLTEHTSYRVTCFGPHPTGEGIDQLTVWVRAPEPTIDVFEADPVWVRRDHNTTISWEVNNPTEVSGVATQCTFSRDGQEVSVRELNSSNPVWIGTHVETIRGVTNFSMNCQSTAPGQLLDSNEVNANINVFVLPIYSEF